MGPRKEVKRDPNLREENNSRFVSVPLPKSSIEPLLEEILSSVRKRREQLDWPGRNI
jgi:hypothetical protein